MVVQTCDNRFGVSTWIVGSSLSAGATHTTIASALASASAGDTIWIKPGTYTENLTIPANLVISGMPGGDHTSNVLIVGKLSQTVAGSSVFSNIRFRTNGDVIYDATVAGLVQTRFQNCNFELNDGDGFTMNTSQGGFQFRECQFYQNANSLDFFNITATNRINAFYCIFYNSGPTYTPGISTIASGAIELRYCNVTDHTFTTSGTGWLNLKHCILENLGTNATPITTAGTGTSYCEHSRFVSGTASAISVGTGTTLHLRNCSIDSTNATPVTGLGTVVYPQVEMTNSGTTIDTTTQTKRTVKAGTIDTNIITANASDGGNSIAVPRGYVSNLGITYASSTLSITAADGSALSATNPGYVTMVPDGASGTLKKYTITANQGFIDDTGSSEIVGNLFGLTTSIAHADAIPFYIYAVTNDSDDAIAFMISRVPGRSTSVAAGDIGAPDDPVADNQYGFFSFENIDESVYANNPAVMIGSFRMTMSASDDWTVVALGARDGIGRYQENEYFTVSPGQFGAASGKYFQDNGGTAPRFSGNSVTYMLGHLDRTCHFTFSFVTCDVDGAGAVDLHMAIPFNAKQNYETLTGVFTEIGSGNRYIVTATPNTAGTQMISFYRDGVTSVLQNQDIDTGDHLRMTGKYVIAW